ncbi:MAG: membrane lipoprotein lipid attachment site-containing protein, partial [Leptospirales bacterium]|nr:membrane lipoprotein lipid attachment site-containing protein [Leptospirales bacterium]
MKRSIFFIISALLLLAACSKNPHDEPETPKEIDSLAAALWTYPVPGTEEWSQLEAEGGADAPYQVPKEVLEKI